jgi:hypothetical protein
MHWREFITLLGVQRRRSRSLHSSRQLGTAMAQSLSLTLVTLVLLHPLTVAHSQDSQDASEVVSSGIEIPTADCLGPAARRSWAAIADKTASSGNAIEHIHTASDEKAETLTICASTARKNSNISLRFKVLQSARGSGGVAFRMATPDAYYLAKIDVFRERALLLLVNNGTEEEIVGVDVDVSFNAWHTLAVRAQDDRFTVYLDGLWIFTGYDKTLAHAGRIALWAEPRSATRFDRIKMGPIASPSVGQTGLPVGTYTFANGDKYVGEMNFGAMHGQGTYTFANGDKYVGEFKRSQPNGQGIYSYVDGDTYVGGVSDGKQSGQGTYTFANGNKFVGEFKDGKFSGRGTRP